MTTNMIKILAIQQSQKNVAYNRCKITKTRNN